MSAPSSQPEPMIEPSEMNINGIGPTSRRKLDVGAVPRPVDMSVIVNKLPKWWSGTDYRDRELILLCLIGHGFRIIRAEYL
ncbi:hypothetical protein GCM10009608_30540 [Pseudonocardia alaniniphila]